MRKLFARQLAQATGETGELDLAALGDLIVGAYEEMERDQKRTDRSIALMIEELGQAHQQLVDAFEVVPEGIALFDADDRYVRWNQKYAELYRESGDKIAVGATFEEVLRAGLDRGQYPEAEGREEEWLQERLAQHSQSASVNEQRLPGDRWLRIEERRTATGGSVGVRVDITDLKRREESFRLLFKNNPIPMFVCDAANLSLLAVNEAALRHYGYPREQLMAMSVLDLRHPDDQDGARQLAQTGAGNHQAGQVRRHVKADGSEIKVAIYSKPLNHHGKAATLFAAIDVTEQLDAKRKLEERTQQLNGALENISQGLCMFDRDGRIVVFNERFATLMGMPSDLLRCGTLLDVFQHRQEIGTFPGDPEEFLAQIKREMREGRQTLRIREMPDGQILRVIDHPMSDGGWVATIEDITEIRRAEAEVVRLARHDPLTDLPNRVLFNEKLEEGLNEVERGEKIAVLCLDLDHFKDVNDSLGHPVGDELLKAVARRLNDGVRESDTVARLGGDEFAIVQSGIKDVGRDVEQLASRLIEVIGTPFRLNEQEVVVGLSIGISISPDDSADSVELLRNADMALYRAKADGRATYRFFETEMDARAQARRALELDLRAALVKGEFEPYFQPIYNIESNDIVAFEALMRWHHPRRGLVPPMDFIPLAEQTGLIVPLGEWMMRKACEVAATWPQPIRIAVNLSPVQFKSRNLLPAIVNALSSSKLEPQRLELEITEGVLLDNNAANMRTLHAIRDLGVRIAMDDFGTGYCSLSYLRSFPFDKIKIDQSFIREVAKREDSTAIVRAVSSIGKSLSIVTTAEGVETEAELAFVRQEGCSEVQGYLFSHPIPAPEVEKLLAQGKSTRAVA